jgi:hypothetical protein
MPKQKRIRAAQAYPQYETQRSQKRLQRINASATYSYLAGAIAPHKQTQDAKQSSPTMTIRSATL